MLSEGPDDETPFLATNREGVFPKKRPIGEYDPEILCKECEKTFGEWDDYAFDLLVNRFSQFTHVVDESTEIAYYKKDYDYGKLKLFCISVLWRAGISQRDYFKAVDLGNHEPTLRELIHSRAPGKCDEYSVQFFRFTGFDYGIPIIMPVHIDARSGFEYYRIYLGRLFFDIKVGTVPAGEHGIGQLCEGSPLVVTNMDIRSMDEYRVLKLVANSPNNANAI